MDLHTKWYEFLYERAALHNAWSPIIASIFSGNAIVLKCSEHVVWSTDWFVGAIHKALEACGHDADIVQVSQYPGLSSASECVSRRFVAGLTKRRY